MGAVDIQDTPDFPVYMDGQDNFRIGCAVAGNVAGKFMDILHQLYLILRHRGTADTPAHRNPDTGRLALEGD